MYVRSLTDARMMTELGGPLREAGLEEKLRGIVADVRAGTVWFSVIVSDDGGAAGSVCIWEHDWNGAPISEIGWMVLPEYQGRGLATEAVTALLARARSERRWDLIHAFPGVTNGPSNAICRKARFTKLEERDMEGWGGILRCNHWRIDRRRVRIPDLTTIPRALEA